MLPIHVEAISALNLSRTSEFRTEDALKLTNVIILSFTCFIDWKFDKEKAEWIGAELANLKNIYSGNPWFLSGDIAAFRNRLASY